MSRRIYGKKTKVDGITFDSELEAKYYLHLKDKGDKIQHLSIHESFTLQEAFTDQWGNKHKEITYAPDFIYLNKEDDIWYYVDTKGYLDDMSRLVWKLFVKHVLENNPEEKKIKFQIIKHSKTTGFVEYHEYKKLMASARRKATAAKNAAIAAKENLKKELKTIKKLREKSTPLTELQTRKLAELEEKHKELI